MQGGKALGLDWVTKSEDIVKKNIIVSIASIYAWVVSVVLICLSIFSFLKIQRININVIPLILGVILLFLIIRNKYYAYQMAGVISVLSLWPMFGFFMPFENNEAPEGVKLILIIFVMAILIVMAGFCFSVKKQTE